MKFQSEIVHKYIATAVSSDKTETVKDALPAFSLF